MGAFSTRGDADFSKRLVISNHFFRRMVLACCFFVSCASLVAQLEQPALAQASAGPIAAGQRFDIVFRIPDTGLAAPQMTLPTIPAGISLISGPEVFSDVGLDDNGRRSRFVFLRYVFRAASPGYVEFPSTVISQGGQLFRTNALLIGIGLADNPRRIPPDLIWQLPEGRVFEGQTVLVSLNLRFVTVIGFPDKVEIPHPQGGIFEEVTGIGNIETETVAEQSFQKIPVATYLFTPSTPGTLTIPGARVVLDGITLSASSVRIVVESLPPEVQSTGAVGNLTYSMLLNTSQIVLDEQTNLVIRVEGEGNLNFLRIPEPDLQDLLVLSESENSRFIPSPLGYRGFRETIYRISSQRTGNIVIRTPPFSSIASDGTVVTSPSRSVVLRVDASQRGGSEKTQHRFVPLTAPEVEASQPLYLYKRWETGFIFLPGLVFFIVGFSLGGRRKRLHRAAAVGIMGLFLWAQEPGYALSDHARLIDEGNTAFAAGNYQGAYDTYLRALALDPGNPGIMYNLSLAAFEKGSVASGVFYGQRALRILPNRADIRASLDTWQASLSLDRQHSVNVLFPSDSFLLAGAVFWTLAGMIVCFTRARLRSLWLILCMVFCLGTLAAGSALLFGINQTDARIGVVTEAGGVLKRIPELAADEWLSLPSGTSVAVSVRSGAFYLVETSYGIKGWLDGTSLYFDEGAYGGGR